METTTRFVLKQKSYNQQFSHVYVSRLLLLREAITRRINEDTTDGNDTKKPSVLPKIIDLKDGDECIIIGTVLKVLRAKPNLFDALTSEDGVAPLETLGRSLASEDDQLILEDESGRVELIGDINIGQLVTGVVLGARGRMSARDNGFDVKQIYCPEYPPQHALPERQESEYVALVSGLSMGRNADPNPLRSHVLVDYLAGRIGDEQETKFVSQIVRTIVVGNSIETSNGAQLSSHSHDVAAVKTTKNNKKSIEELALDAEPMKNMDELLSSLACSMCVDIMPGRTDPSNYTLPQQSFHPCLFPRSSRFASFRAVTNPYEAQIGGVQFFGHSGQPLQSMLQCTTRRPQSDDVEMNGNDEDDEDAESERALDCLQRCLGWRHAAPTAPDLVACFPMVNEDPFILETCPHVLFAGNQKHFSTRMTTGKCHGACSFSAFY
ncbi:DNA polymerase alpha/epsilon subunit b, partial [Globisporangium splendens]